MSARWLLQCCRWRPRTYTCCLLPVERTRRAAPRAARPHGFSTPQAHLKHASSQRTSASAPPALQCRGGGPEGPVPPQSKAKCTPGTAEHTLRGKLEMGSAPPWVHFLTISRPSPAQHTSRPPSTCAWRACGPDPHTEHMRGLARRALDYVNRCGGLGLLIGLCLRTVPPSHRLQPPYTQWGNRLSDRRAARRAAPQPAAAHSSAQSLPACLPACLLAWPRCHPNPDPNPNPNRDLAAGVPASAALSIAASPRRQASATEQPAGTPRPTHSSTVLRGCSKGLAHG